MLASGDGTVDLNIDNGTFVVDVSTSRVGIGNSSPSVKLDVTGAMALSGNADFNGNLDVSGTTVSAGKITADAGIDIDNINIDGTTIALSSGDLTLDVAGDIVLDADGGEIRFKDGGTEIAVISNKNAGGTVTFTSSIADKDIQFVGNDNGSAVTALSLDMSAAGAATFNSSLSATHLTATNGVLNLDDNGSHNGIINSPASLLVNIDSDNGATNESFVIAKDRTSTSGGTELFRVQENGSVGIGNPSPAATLHVDPAANVTTGFGTPLVKVGGDNSWAGNGSLYSVGFGYVDSSVSNKSPAEIGLVTTSATGHTLGDLVFATRSVTSTTAPTERMRIDSTGRVAITNTSGSLVIGGTTGRNTLYASTSITAIGIFAEGNYANCSAHYESSSDANSGWSPFYVNKFNWSAGKDARWMSFVVNGGTDSGTIAYDGTNFSIVNASDYRIKENVVAYTGGLAKINAIGVKSFNKIDGVSSHITQEGFIAHELKEVLPHAVIGGKDAMKVNELGETVPDYQTVSREALIPYLVSAIQEQQATIEALTTRLTALENN